MESTTNTKVYRVFDMSSRGTNTPDCVGSELSLRDPNAKRFKYGRLHYFAKPEIGGTKRAKSNAKQRKPAKDQLKMALNRIYAPHNPFVFFTTSFALAIIHAEWLLSQQEKKKNPRPKSTIYIMCLDVTTARTPAGHPVNLRPVREVMQELRLRMTARRTGDELDFNDVYMTTDTIVPGAGSSIAPFDALEQRGLYRCVPEFDAIKAVTPGIATPIKHCRAFWFQTDVDLSDEEKNLAAKVAATFKPIASSDNHDLVQMHIFSWFLTTKDQGANLPGLQEWLRRRAHAIADGAKTRYTSPPAEVIELKRFDEIMQTVSGWYMKKDEVENLNTQVPKERVRERRNDFIQKRWQRNRIVDKKKHEDKAAQDKKRAGPELPGPHPFKKSKTGEHETMVQISEDSDSDETII